MLDDFGRALQASYFTNPCDRGRAAHKKDPEFEVLVGVEPLCVNAKFSHKTILSRFRFVPPFAGGR